MQYTEYTDEFLAEFVKVNPNNHYVARDVATGTSLMFRTRHLLFEYMGLSDAVFNKVCQRPWVSVKNKQLFSLSMLSQVSSEPLPFSRKTFMRNYAYRVITFSGTDKVFYGSEGIAALEPYLRTFDDASAKLRGVQFILITEANCEIHGADRDRMKALGLCMAHYEAQNFEYDRHVAIAKSKTIPLFNQTLEVA